MKKNQDQPMDAAERRRRAEARLKGQRPPGTGRRSEVETARLVHELEVHQIELEMQNEELQQARAQVEALLAEYTELYDFAPTGYLTLDSKGMIRQVNLTGARLLGEERSALLKRRFSLFVAENDRSTLNDFLAKVSTSEGVEWCEVTLAQNGPPVFVRIEGTRFDDGPDCRAVMVDITERKRAQAAEARVAMAKVIERKNHELESLVFVTSHDLRTPLLNIQGFSQLLQEACADLQRAAAVPEWDGAMRREVTAIAAVTVPKALGFIQASAEKMNRLIAGLLRLSRLGREGVKLERLDLNRMFEEIRTAMARQLQAAGAIVEVDPLPPCEGDTILIHQLFTHLLDNAVKYRDPARPLRVRLGGRREADRVIYALADNGAGIPPAHLEKVWELFHRVDPKGAVTGEGLGLSLVRRIVELHRGEIGVESTVGQGSRFIVTLPVADAGEGRAT